MKRLKEVIAEVNKNVVDMQLDNRGARNVTMVNIINDMVILISSAKTIEEAQSMLDTFIEVLTVMKEKADEDK